MRFFFITFTLFLISITACNKDEFEITNLNNNEISILGHAGMGISSIYPMNTLESILNCLNLGADGTELDVQMTKDSVLVAFHDLELSDRTTAKGRIYNQKWNDIQNAAYKDPIYAGYEIITIDEMFSNLNPHLNKTFAFDCKNFNPDTSFTYLNRFCNALIAIIEKYGIQNNCIIEFKREDLIQTMKQLRPNWNIFVYQEYDYALELCQKYRLQGIVISVDKISTAQVENAHQLGLKVMVFNAHSNQRNRDAISKNVDIIQTDNLKNLLRILR